ncbi:MAG: hypothetical protein E4G95_00880 [Bacteroidia bacterium]|nr:MAG: hypothetical protein E4G95_00880 [Bacteroidia bacterium]
MKKRYLLIITALMLLAGSTYSQESDGGFKPSGKPFIKVYTNYHSTFTEGEASKMFEIQRAYLGYQYNLGEKLSGAVTLDVGDPNFGDLHMTAYLKTAYIQYNDGKLIAKIGMIGLDQYKLQEDMWGGRYLYKSFMDEHKFGPSADLGAFVGYRLHKMVSVDFTLANGDGYKSPDTDSIFKYSPGITLTPVRGLDIRASYDYMGRDYPQQTVALYAGYSSGKFRVGAEYNYQYNHKMVASNDLQGLSFYGSFQAKKARLFGRYDRLSSVIIEGETDPWNLAKDGQVLIAGVEFSPVKGLIIAPNYQGWIPADGSPVSHSPFLNIEIKF